MPRSVERPAVVVLEEIRSVEEYPPIGDHTPGVVRVMVGQVDKKGNFPAQQMESYEITGEDYELLIGDGAGWAAKGKPKGTYRNDDLWYFIDKQREKAAQE